MTLEEFEQLVEEAVRNLPWEFAVQLDNVGIIVEAWPSESEMNSIKAHPGTLLFGLYRGVPKTKRPSNYSALPDKIIIYAGPILAISKDLEDAKRKVAETVFHEIGHHFGMSDEQIYRAQKNM